MHGRNNLPWKMPLRDAGATSGHQNSSTELRRDYEFRNFRIGSEVRSQYGFWDSEEMFECVLNRSEVGVAVKRH